jgi:signal transduction histidine kinase
LLYHISIRYFVILLTTIVIVSAAIIFLIYRDVKTTQRSGLERMAEDLAAEAAGRGGRLPDGAELGRLLDQLARRNGFQDRSFVFVFDSDRRLTRQFPSFVPFEPERLIREWPEMSNDRTRIIEFRLDQDQTPYLAAFRPIGNDGEITGYAAYVVRRQTILLSTPMRHRVMRLSIVAIALIIGWGILFELTRRLLKPIQEAAEAAKQIVAGNYEVDMDAGHKEKEIHELMASFKEMAARLKRLESLRNQLFLGVTHELKTPIASISGLIQAVKDGVVSDEEAREFLDMGLKETGRLQKMVEDLLDFNRFAAHTVTVTHQRVDLRAELQEIALRWQQAQEKTNVRIEVETTGERRNWAVSTDPVRLEQIMVNLFNNARDAMQGGGTISVRLYAEPAQYRIEVQDTGEGIPAEEQARVFEPFYRGEKKRAHVHGLGIGLSFSKLISRSLGGDLVLAGSGPEGTTFALAIPAIRSH